MVRAKIQASQIINRLQAHVMGKIGLEPTQVASAKILLDKSVPNLMSTEVTGKDGQQLIVQIAGLLADESL